MRERRVRRGGEGSPGAPARPRPGGPAASRIRARSLVVVVVAVAALGACDGDDGDDGSATPGGSAPASTQATTAPDPLGVPADPQGTDGTTTAPSDGERIAYLVVIYPGRNVVAVDEVEYLTGAAAVEAATAAGAPTPTRAFVRDTDPGVSVEIPLDPAAEVTVLGSEGDPLAFDVTGLTAALSGDAAPEQQAYVATPYRLDVDDGVVVALEQLPAPG